MMDVLESTNGAFNIMGELKYCCNADRPQTKFEKRGENLGHNIYDLIFEKET
jgi:tRNA (guanine-N7-)-methyltransferase